MEDKKPEEPKITGPTSITGKVGFGGKKWVTITMITLAVVAIGALGYLYYDSLSQKKDLERQVATLQQNPNEQEVSDQAPDNIVEEEPIEEPVANCDAPASYSAEVGKFTINLDSPRVIIRNLDGGFEGGPATALDIAICADGEMNVYDSLPQNEVSILANPSSTSANLKASYEAQNGTLTSAGTVTFDGVTANKYTLSGLFNTTVYYFDKAGIGYQIELSDTNSSTNGIFSDLRSDWSFD